ncbi:hypothetical protein MSG28_010011 [Choristoneura fumiferana]|uniref:Uncharacterized protein n=1 Tax=Choristoneura fumiferana TaxID=7141 RepID=A0ACC0KJI2_CHOFU|nr:hypothetical protein MSG28_010011 [Choristoneura fumiferana]
MLAYNDASDKNVYKSIDEGEDILDLGSKLLGDVHCAPILLQCSAAHASFFLITEDAWISYTLEELTSNGSIATGPFTLYPAWFTGGGVTRGFVQCRATATGLQTTALRILSSTATARMIHVLADSLYFSPDHVTIQAEDKDYDICSDDDPDCEYYVNLGTAFPNRPLSATVQIVNHSPVPYSYYWSTRPWGVCSCWQDELATEGASVADEDDSERLCPGAKESRAKGDVINNASNGTQGVCAQPAAGSVAARSSVPVTVSVADAGAGRGTHRAVLLARINARTQPSVIYTATNQSSQDKTTQCHAARRAVRSLVECWKEESTKISADSVKAKLLQDVRNTENNTTAFAVNKTNFNNSDKKQFKGPRCYSCNKYGHKSPDCKTKPKNKVQKPTSSYAAVFVASSHYDDAWYIDSGASAHMTKNKNLFLLETSSVIKNIRVADNKMLSVQSSGQVSLNVCDDKGQENKLLQVFFNNMYRLNMPGGNAYMSGVEKQDIYLWHQRMGHLNFDSLKKMSENTEHVIFSDKIENLTCITCKEGKQTRLPFKSSGVKVNKPLELVHSDICGPMETQSLGGARYFLTFLDDYSKRISVYFLRNKSEALDKFKEFKQEVENQLDARIKILRTDNGLEYDNKNFSDFLKSAGIIHQTTTPYTAEQNGSAERMNRSLVERAKCMLLNANLPKLYWADAIHTAAYVINRSPTKSLSFKTPVEMWSGLKPNVSHMRIFGCEAMVHLPKEKRKKWDPKAHKMIFIGYCDHTKGYRFILPNSRKVIKSRDAVFLESTVKRDFVPVEMSTKKPEKEEESLMNESFTSESSYETVKGNKSSDSEYIPDTSLDSPEISKVTLRPRNKINNKNLNLVHSEENTYLCSVTPGIPETYKEAISSENKDEWIKSIDEELEAHEKNRTWILTEKPPNAKIIGCKWVFRIKEESTGPRYKSRLCAKGFAQTAGIDYTETFAPTVSVPVDPHVKLQKGEGEPEKNIPYREAVGSLMHLATVSRPEIMFAVSLVSRFLTCYNKSHWNAILKIFKYLIETKEYGLYYSQSSQPAEVTGYSDADYANDLDTRRSVTGYVFIKNGAAVTWSSQRQQTVALSTTEAEFMAACAATKEAMWIRQLLCDIGDYKQDTMCLHLDNQSAISVIKNVNFHKRCKHIDIKYHFVKEKFHQKIIDLKAVSSENQFADIFTKALSKDKFQFLRSKLGMSDFISVSKLILKDIPKDSFPADLRPQIVTTRTIAAQSGPGDAKGLSHEVCEVVVGQMEVWWEVAPVRFVLDPPILTLTHSRRAQASSRNERAWAVVPTQAQCGLGTSHTPLNCFAAAHALGVPPWGGVSAVSASAPRLTPARSVDAPLRVPLPPLPNEYPETDVVTLSTVTDECTAACRIVRACGTRHPALAPARAWLGVVPPRARVTAKLEVINDTHQHICWWASPFRWLGENPPSAPCAASGLPCDNWDCRERACTCALLRPARGALAHAHAAELHFKVNSAPDSDRCVATLVQLRRTLGDVCAVSGAAGCCARGSLLAYRVLAPRLVLRVLPCQGDKTGDCKECRLDPGLRASPRGCAVLRPSAALAQGHRSCYTLRVTNLTPIPTTVQWEPPVGKNVTWTPHCAVKVTLAQGHCSCYTLRVTNLTPIPTSGSPPEPVEGDDVLKVEFIPNDFDIGSYGEKEIQVVLEAQKVCGRRLFAHRARLAHAYKPLYLLIDAAIERGPVEQVGPAARLGQQSRPPPPPHVPLRHIQPQSPQYVRIFNDTS